MSSATAGPVLTIGGLQGYLQDAFLRYYETAYELRDVGIQHERRELLAAPGTAFAEPFVELMPQYPTSERTLAAIFTQLGLSEAASLVASGLLPYSQPYVHQEEALLASMSGRDVVVGTGTGSGKTEAFLLPVLARLVEESRGWGESEPSQSRPWWKGKGAFQQQRADGGRSAGMRALVLFPMNALVEDQMVRLRTALDSPDARAWFAEHRPGHRFYFGRYTGRTPVTGTRLTATTQKVDQLRTLMQQADKRHRKLLERIESGDVPPESRYFLPALDGAEMRSRWDMQQSVPDIFITNYSMLSIALSRSDEAPMIEATRCWLDAADEHKFTLVVDELHMYRGTAGTEVAYLLRRLMAALGLDRRPDKLQVIGTSASIQDGAEGRSFLSEFFARTDSAGFTFVTSEVVSPEGADDLSGLASTLLRGDADVAALPSDGTVQRSLTRALSDSDGLRPRAVSEAARRTFPGLDGADAIKALDSLVALLGAQEYPSARLRGHLFVRTLQGLWACVNPTCAKVRSEHREASRKIGALYTSPRFTCECGSRVLELLYCQSCGESMLGGYVARAGSHEFLVSTIATLDGLPDRVIGGRDAAGYRVYWPTDRPPVVTREWRRTGIRRPDDAKSPSYRMRFVKAKLSPGTGLLVSAPTDHTGYVYKVDAGGAEDRMPAFPTRCPSCGDDWEFSQNGPPEDRQRSRSAIRTQGVGFDRANQVLTGALKRRLNSNLVVFSDSRQGAARVAANLELAHYLDLVRALVLTALRHASSDLDLVYAYVNDQDRSSESTSAWSRLQATNQAAAIAMLKSSNGMPLDAGDNSAMAAMRSALSGKPSMVDFTKSVEPRLLALGVNPGGPALSVQLSKKEKSWTALYNWEVEPIRDKRESLDADSNELLTKIQTKLGEQIIKTAFAGGDRDVESLGVAHASPGAAVRIASLDADTGYQFACSVLRIMGRKRRLPSTSDEQSGWPRAAVDYADAVARAANSAVDGAELLEQLGERVGVGISSGFRIEPSELKLVMVREPKVWRCVTCRTKHLHRSAGVCVACCRVVERDNDYKNALHEDYYAWLASESGGAYRLHCEELTGQTDPLDAQARQARFQQVFLDEGENERVDAVDILSVTTTMEAGVDIGALKGVVMANMPPQRFNYQQRVGRAGRRSEHLAVALTVCRGARSHDEHYFAHPASITGDVPPQPFLDTASTPIIRRAFAAQILTEVFRSAAESVQDFAPGRSVHGEFGSVELWNSSAALRAFARDRLGRETESWREAARNLLRATRAVDVGPESLVHWATGELADCIDEVALAARVVELSEALAQAGVLPMFGFPTQVRVLYTKHPRPGREPSTLDRDASIAISEFAPGSEIVKDKGIHTAVGVVDFLRFPNGSWGTGDNPLGTRSKAGVCRACLGITEEQVEQCPTCRSGAPDFSVLELVEPLGYRTSFRARDYEQLGDPTSRASQPRLSLQDSPYESRDGNALVRSANAVIVAVNDNDGHFYSFVPVVSTYQGKQKQAPGLLEVTLLTDVERSKKAKLWGYDVAGAVTDNVALSARRRTDVLLLGVDHLAPGLTISPQTPSGRGAWASLGYLLRDTAAKWLDISPDEIQVGLHPSLRGGVVRGEVFIADTLENGAGYASRLASKFEALLDEADRFAVGLQSHGDKTCDSSCYSCLRDYSNRSWHPLLDWRLAVDVLDLLRGRRLVVDRQHDRDLAAATSFGCDFGFEVLDEELPLVFGRRDSVLAVLHPFEDSGESSVNKRVVTLRSQFPGVQFTSSFELLRRPGSLIGGLMA